MSTTTTAAASTRLVRFVSKTDGQTYYGLADSSLQEAEALTRGSPFSDRGGQQTGIKHAIDKLLSPLARDDCRGIVCIGLNYRDHAEEANMAIPTVPVVFRSFKSFAADPKASIAVLSHKPITALSGPYDDLRIPKVSWDKGGLDYEAELVGNDFSNRPWQLEKTLSGGQWCFSKSFDTTAPIGPAIIAKDGLGGDASNLSIRTVINGETLQDSSTNQMIFSAAKLVSFLSQGMTLLPGTLIFTGTPAGVGLGRSPQFEVKEGDVVEVAIEGIGSIKNTVVYER
ncbi:fumarylacetoacetate (FAA) hydrolase family protein [Sarocladium implicatum]|nr:fumarylacetoacetate (FAA) hydrolase family protein [Sarocladium implicatum]